MKLDYWLYLEEADNHQQGFHINYCCIFIFFCPQSIAINMKDSKGAKLIREVGFDSMQTVPVLYCFHPE